MGDKFDKLVGNFKVSIGSKDYPFAMTLRQRGMYNNLRMKMDQEIILSFLFERFREGYLNANKAIGGADITQGEIEIYEKELGQVFLLNYETISTQVMLALGIITQEQLDKMQKDVEGADVIESFLQAKLRDKKGEGR